jgi:lipopolysaccharide transport system ATP-binding protein
MSDISIRVENISKMYLVGEAYQRHDTLRDLLVDIVKRPFRGNGNRGESNRIWALKDISFEVKRGEVLGIIGRNGAGKSTLLKILSRITEPNEGRAVINGRVGSLLEVGTGFHPELTGRENIYLNGSILGMRRNEIDRKFDQIVDFAEIDRFLDTPVKRYSSGMYIRLAFAVAAHLETEVLLVDEVLAVGDAIFQKKCLGKMDEISKEGRTVLFVSHNLAAVEHICSTGIVIEQGKILSSSMVWQAIDDYQQIVMGSINRNTGSDKHVIYEKPNGGAQKPFEITKIELLDKTSQPKPRIFTWDNVKIRIHYTAAHSVKVGSLQLQIADTHGAKLFLTSTQPDRVIPMQIAEGCHFGDCEIECLPLSAGEYIIGCGLAIPNKEYLCWEENLANLSVEAKDVYNSGMAPLSSRSLLAIPHSWDV